tara:strand:- start:1248 stop:1751 length:504 start_codon:yes stop_codon:yes gene_type:complete
MILACFLLAGASISSAQQKIQLNHDHSKMEKKQVLVEFSDENVAEAYENYAHLKNDLVGSNPGDAKKAAMMLGKALAKIEGVETALAVSTQIAETDDLQSQRKTFSQLSEAMEPIVRRSIKSGKIYKDFCPMAFNEGAYWLSSIEDIRNPYYGARMLNCGKVEEIIK